MEDDKQQPPESLLPYTTWIEEALRQVVARAVEHVAVNGLPGAHHFYLTFRTDHPGTVIPNHLRERYPKEMTIVLQHQFWDLKYVAETRVINVGLSFGGIPSTLTIPLDALAAFADPHVGHALRFSPIMPATEPEPVVEAEADAAPDTPKEEEHQVVSLDAFRRRSPPKR